MPNHGTAVSYSFMANLMKFSPSRLLTFSTALFGIEIEMLQIFAQRMI